MNEQQSFFIGIDVSKLWFDASLLPVKKHVKQAMQTMRFNNDEGGIKAFGKWLKANNVAFEEALIVIENTGIYHRRLWSFCSQKSLAIHIGNAAHIKWSFGIARGKNDKIDSERLCNYAFKEADALKNTPPLNPAIMQLKDLMAARTRLLSQKNANKVHINELKNVNDTSIQKVLESAYRSAIEGLTKSIKNMEAAINKIIAADESMRTNYNLLISVPGIGHLTAVYIICCTYNFICKVTGKQLACYAAVVPFENTSGTSIRGKARVHKMGNKELKKMLHLCALSAVRTNGEFKTYYERKKEEGKHSMSILNAIRNKLLLRAVAVVNNKRPYVDNHAFAA